MVKVAFSAFYNINDWGTERTPLTNGEDVPTQMLKKLHEAKPFSFKFDETKETYTLDELKTLIAQNENAVVANYDRLIEAEFNNIAAEKETFAKNATELQAELAKAKAGVEELSKVKTDLEAKVSTLDGELAPIRAERKAKTAVELLDGLVVKSSEVDVYDLLADKFKFEDADTIEKRREKVKPVVEELFKAKPYYKPAVAAGESEEEKKLDDKLLLVDENGKTIEVNPISTSRRLSYEGN